MSSKENKKQAQRRRAEERERAKKQEQTKRIITAIAVVAVIVGMVLIVGTQWGGGSGSAENETNTSDTTEQTEGTDEDETASSSENAPQGELDTTEGAVVEDGDWVNIDYTGYKDGEKFEGGSTEETGPYDLHIGSNTFIDGFEEGLIGKKVGDKVDLDLTFPENYGSKELAGADVVFKVEIHGIYK